MHRFGSLGGTNTAAAVAAHFRRGKHARVVIVTDEQAMGPVSPARAVPDDVRLYTWNLAGHRDHVQVHQVGARAAALTGVRVVEATVPRELVRRLGRLLLLLRLLRRHTLDEMRGYGTPNSAITHKIDVRRHAAPKGAALAKHQTQLSGRGRSARLFRALTRLPLPAFRAICGTEWFTEPGGRTGRLISDNQASSRDYS